MFLPSYLHDSPSIPMYGKDLSPPLAGSRGRALTRARGGSTDTYDADNTESESESESRYRSLRSRGKSMLAKLPKNLSLGLKPSTPTLHFSEPMLVRPMQDGGYGGEKAQKYVVGATTAERTSLSLISPFLS